MDLGLGGQTAETLPPVVQPAPAAPDAIEAFKQGALGSIVGGVMQRMASPDDTKLPGDWRNDYLKYEIAQGYHSNPDERSIIEDARNPEDWKYRTALIDERREYGRRLGEATGIEKLAHFGAGMLGGMSTSGVEMAFSMGVAVPMVMRAGQAAGSFGNLARMAVAQVPVEAAGSVFRQRLMQSETMLDQLGMDMLSAVAFELPPVLLAAGRIGRAGKARAAFDTAQAGLVQAIDDGATRATVEAHAANVEALRERIISAARQEGDDIAAQVWQRVGPDAKVHEIDQVIRDMKEQEREVLLSMSAAKVKEPVGFERPDRIAGEAPDARVLKFVAEQEVARGVALSPEAGAIIHRAYNVWDDTVPKSLQEMQGRLQSFFDMRKDKLDDYKGVAKWLDSPGLEFQLSKSRVTKFAGAMLVESASGLGKREYTAALDYENTRKTLEHKYVSPLGDALTADRSFTENATALLGGGSMREKKFWYDVQLDRLRRREYIKQKAVGEYESTASENVKRAARLLDGYWKDAADQLTRHGHEEGDAILGGGFVGHVPYHFDAREVSRLYRDDPQTFTALRGLLQEQFESKVMLPVLEDLNKNWDTYLADHMSNLRSTVAALQDKLAGLEEARRAVQNLRDDVTTVNANRKEVWATIEKIQEQERALKAELAAMKSEPSGSAGRAAIGAEADADFAALARGETLPGELGREDASSFLERVLLTNKLDEESPEYILGQQLLSTMREDATPALLTLRRGTGEQRSYFAMDGDVSHVSMRLRQTTLADNVPLDVIAKNLRPEDVRTLLHEMSHYRTQAMIYGVEQGRISKPEIVAAVGKIMKLRDDVSFVLKGQVLDDDVKYALTDNHEFVAQFYNSETFRATLHKQKYKGEALFNRVLNVLLEVLGFDKKKSAFTELHSAVTDLLEARGSVPISGRTIKFSDNPRAAEITKQLEHLKAAKEQLRESHREAKKQADAAGADKKAIQELTNVKAVKGIEASLNMHRAALAKAEESPGVVVEKMRLALTEKARDKAQTLTNNYMRQIMSNPENRVVGKELRLADMAQEILTENWAGESITPKLAEDFRAKLSERVQDRTRTELDLTKSVQVGDKEVRLLDLIEVDGQAMVKRSAHRVAGEGALARKGLHDPRQQQALVEAMEFDGATEREISEMKFILDMFSGRISPGSNPQAWAAWRNWVYTARMGKLGEAMIADAMGTVATLGVASIPKAFGKMAEQIFSGRAFVKDGKLTPLGKQLTEIAPGTMGMDHMLHTMHAEGGGGDSAVSTTGWMTRAMSRGAQLTSWVSGANTVSTVTHRAITPYIADEILGAIATGKSALTDARLADLGLSGDNLTLIQKFYNEFDAGRKPGERVQLEKWKGADGQYAADLLIGAINRGTFQTLQKALIGEQPSWSQATQLGQLVAQLHTFGLVAAEKQAARNIAHGDSNTALYFSMGLAWATMLYIARVHASAISKPADKRNEYLQQRMSGGSLANGVFMLWNASGILPETAALGQVFWGNKEERGKQATRGGGPIAAYGLVADAVEAVQTTGNWVRGVEREGQLLKEWKQALPGGNTRLIEWLTKD
jgi:hypothetical protein